MDEWHKVQGNAQETRRLTREKEGSGARPTKRQHTARINERRNTGAQVGDTSPPPNPRGWDKLPSAGWWGLDIYIHRAEEATQAAGWWGSRAVQAVGGNSRRWY